MRHEETLVRASGRPTSYFDFSGEWANQLSSTMDVIQQASVVTGVYTSQVSGRGIPAIGQLQLAVKPSVMLMVPAVVPLMNDAWKKPPSAGTLTIV